MNDDLASSDAGLNLAGTPASSPKEYVMKNFIIGALVAVALPAFAGEAAAPAPHHAAKVGAKAVKAEEKTAAAEPKKEDVKAEAKKEEAKVEAKKEEVKAEVKTEAKAEAKKEEAKSTPAPAAAAPAAAPAKK